MSSSFFFDFIIAFFCTSHQVEIIFLLVFLLTRNSALQRMNHTKIVLFSSSKSAEIIKFITTLQTRDGDEHCSIIFGILSPRRIFSINFNADIQESTMDVNKNIPVSHQKLLPFRCNEKDVVNDSFCLLTLID